MWNPASPTRSALAFSMSAAVAFLGGAMLLKAGRAFPQLTGGAGAGGQPGILLLAVVVLLGVSGVLLLAIAGKELLDRRRTHAAAPAVTLRRPPPA
jgi:hypothetical protein